MPFNPEAPLPESPDPWAGSVMPALRDGPPFMMTEMIAAEPALAERLARRLPLQPAVTALASTIRDAAGEGRAVVTTGCGTSEHAAMAVAAFLKAALRGGASGGAFDPRVASVQAFELSRLPPRDGVVVAISHEGGTWATNEALRAARAAGCTTALVTVSDRSPGAALADLIITTDEQDQSWCHTVGYLSPLLAGATLLAALQEQRLDPIGTRALLQAADDEPSAESIAASLRHCSRLLLVGSGIDYVTARELALKVEEGARVPANAHQLETIRHGHLAAADERTGLVLVLTDGEARGAVVVDRARAVLRSAAALGMPAAAILAADLGDDVPLNLTWAGRTAVPLTSHLPRLVAAALAAAIPAQLVAERLARARGVNPDTLGREDPRQAAAADA
jgi:glucosamine--fructose-6-phosphate aminotransferase (isomerizing)